MYYSTRQHVRLFQSSSYRGRHIFLYNNVTPAQHSRIRYWAERVPPPSAPSIREIRANCQTWCIDVMTELLNEGIGRPDALAEARSIRSPFPSERRMQPIEHPMMHPMHVRHPSDRHPQQQQQRPPIMHPMHVQEPYHPHHQRQQHWQGRREDEDSGCCGCVLM